MDIMRNIEKKIIIRMSLGNRKPAFDQVLSPTDIYRELNNSKSKETSELLRVIDVFE